MSRWGDCATCDADLICPDCQYEDNFAAMIRKDPMMNRIYETLSSDEAQHDPQDLLLDIHFWIAPYFED